MYGLRVRAEPFHVVDMFQVLREEPRSLFCIANFQVIPARLLRLIRCFTQFHHSVLLLNRGVRDLLSEEHELRRELNQNTDSACEDVFYAG